VENQEEINEDKKKKILYYYRICKLIKPPN